MATAPNGPDVVAEIVLKAARRLVRRLRYTAGGLAKPHAHCCVDLRPPAAGCRDSKDLRLDA